MAFSGCSGQCVAVQNFTAMKCLGEVRPCGELFFFLLKEEPMVLRELVWFGPSIPVETVKACAMVELHMMIEENSGR